MPAPRHAWPARLRRTTGLAGAALVCAAALAASARPAAANAVVVTDVPCSGSGGGAAGLVAALRRAAGSEVAEITLAAGCVYSLAQVDNVDSAVGANGLPVIASTVVISGNGATITRSSAAGTPGFRFFDVVPSGNLTLLGVTLSGGLTAARCDENFGGAIFDLGTLTLRRVVVQGNGAVDSSSDAACLSGGGGIFVGALDAATLDATTVIGNTATGHGEGAGGGILNQSGTLSVLSGSVVSGNTADGRGGGIASVAEGEALTIEGTTVDGNSAGIGGGIYANSGLVPTLVSITDTVVRGNSASFFGGGIANLNAEVLLVDSTVTANQPDNCYPSGSVPGCKS